LPAACSSAEAKASFVAVLAAGRLPRLARALTWLTKPMASAVGPIRGENSAWQKIRINNINIPGKKVEVGFLADGAADSFFVDDIELVKVP
jgi:hypothetical protein